MSVSEGKYLVFSVGDAEYAAAITGVREIRLLEGVTSLPDCPPHVLGVMDLRGRVVPLLDLRLRLGRQPAGERPVVVIVDVGGQAVGLVVDRVVEVRSFAGSVWQEVPTAVPSHVRAFVRGVADLAGRILLWLDLDRLLAVDAAELAQAVGAGEEEGPGFRGEGVAACRS